MTTTAALTYWRCLTCGETGQYVEPETKTDTSPAAKHGHATVSHAAVWSEQEEGG